VSGKTITDDLLRFVQREVPASAAEIMCLSLFDWAACGIAGAAEATFEDFVSAQKALSSGNCTLFGGGRVAAPLAALINGTLSHALDYDDTHFAHIGHPSVAVLPAVIALAEDLALDLETVVEAAAIGLEASILVGLWLGRTHYQVGYHQTATAGAFGATLGACRLMALAPDQTRAALGLCVSMASGVKAQFGTMAKPLNAGLAARTGVEAALWAQAGMTAAADGLAGPLGFGETHHAEQADVAMPNRDWHLPRISHKFHACCHGLHAMLEALSDSDLPVDQIESLTIRTHPRWLSVCNIARPKTGLEAKFSYAQAAAMTLLGHNTADIDAFEDQIVSDPEIVELRGKVRVREGAQLSETQAEISVKMTNGAMRRFRHDLMTPMSAEQRAEKLKRKGAALVGVDRANVLWDAAQGESLRDLTDQMSA
jgi:2-methylcitrate dehydratase PrpD